jgi:hypothetical protein
MLFFSTKLGEVQPNFEAENLFKMNSHCAKRPEKAYREITRNQDIRRFPVRRLSAGRASQDRIGVVAIS